MNKPDANSDARWKLDKLALVRALPLAVMCELEIIYQSGSLETAAELLSVSPSFLNHRQRGFSRSLAVPTLGKEEADSGCVLVSTATHRAREALMTAMSALVQMAEELKAIRHEGVVTAAAQMPPGLAGGEQLKKLPFSKRVHTLRLERGWSLATLAAKSGVSKVAVFKWEIGRSIPRPGHLQDLANALGVTPDFLSGAPSNGAKQSVQQTLPE